MHHNLPVRAIQIDASMNCQLACPVCPTAEGLVNATMGAGHLDPAKFEALLDSNPQLAEVELSNYGEMFLNPRLVELLRIAWERKVTLHADNGVNLNFAREDALEGLVKYQFRSLTCSIDGCTPETYRQYRVNGDLDRVLGYVRRINEHKRKYNSGFPLIKWQFIAFGHNEHELADARKQAQELGMIFVPKLSWDNEFSPIRNRELVQIQLRSQNVSRDEHHVATGMDYMRAICYQLWHAPVLNWDGRLNGCCRNFWGHFGGNAFQDGLDETVNGEGIRHARAMLMGRAAERPGLPCTTCDLYQTMKRDGTWLTDAELSAATPGILCSLVVDAGDSEATHADVFLAPGREVNPLLLARPPQGLRFEIGKSFGVRIPVPRAGDYTLYALPRRMDPTFRSVPTALPPVTQAIQVVPRPLAQEFHIGL
jgi:MoaA/NifB/PqqE/SkfB family radical SAM enzyme